MGTALYFEDLQVGQRFVTAPELVGEAAVAQFAAVSGDFNPIHMDAEHAAHGVFGRPVAHGLLVVSMSTGMLYALGLFRESMGAMLSVDDWKFHAPVFIDDAIHVEMTIEQLRLTSDGERGVVRRLHQIRNQDGLLVQEGRITSLIMCRPVTSSAPSTPGEAAIDGLGAR